MKMRKTNNCQDQVTSDKPDLAAAYRRRIPTEPLEHESGKVGISSRWWYLPGMYKPVANCERCTKPETTVSTGAAFANSLRKRYRDNKYKSSNAGTTAPVERTGQLYRIPRIRPLNSDYRTWSQECITWPRYLNEHFAMNNVTGETFLEMSIEEWRALQIIVLKTSVESETFSVRGPGHHKNWKKVGLSRAYFKKDLVQESSMPTKRAKAAFRFLWENNEYFKAFQQMQARNIVSNAPLNVSSYDLFVLMTGIECAMFPHLYPTTDFTDTGIKEHYRHKTDDDTNRVVSIGMSWTRKALSSVRVYAEHRDLTFFLYERHMANKFFTAQCRAQSMGVTGDYIRE